MEEVLREVEKRSGFRGIRWRVCHAPAESAAGGAAGEATGVECSAFPPIAVTKGIWVLRLLGDVAIGVENAAGQAASERTAVFLASLAPGLLFGGGWMVPTA